ncbi:MAG TPA: hypothetical protein VK447_01015, partial [Myxococcaceae bacterium]|nr:hypothetical protein [Myxococcaceae bacterium]
MSLLPVVVMLLAAAPSADVPPSLANARQRAEELRFEEAVVEYQRYLGELGRPVGDSECLSSTWNALPYGSDSLARTRDASASGCVTSSFGREAISVR